MNTCQCRDQLSVHDRGILTVPWKHRKTSNGRDGKVRGGFLEEMVLSWSLNGKRWGEAMGYYHTKHRHRGKDIEAAENWQNLHEPQQLGMLRQQITAGGRAGEGTAQRHKPLHFQAQRNRKCGKWKCLCGGGNGAGRQWGLQLVAWAEKVIPGRGKVWRWESGREIFREAFDLAGGEGCSSFSDYWEPAKPMHRNLPCRRMASSLKEPVLSSSCVTLDESLLFPHLWNGGDK